MIDVFLGTAFLERTVEMSKIINLYAIMKTDLIFFNDKAEQSEIVANWSDINEEKLKRAMMTVLYESGMLIQRKGEEIKPLLLDEDIKQHLINLGDRIYVEALGDRAI